MSPITDIRYSSFVSLCVPIRNTADYSPFGVQLDGRTIQGDFYRRGFNGMEKDDEVKGGGNSYDFGARIYDSRVGRWLTIDPLADKYPFYSPFVFVADCPIKFVDPDGERIIINYGDGQKYEYGSGLKLPKDKFVRQTFRTLKKIERRGLDPLGIINEFENSTDINVDITKGEWFISALSTSTIGYKKNEGSDKTEVLNITEFVNSRVAWNPRGGGITTDGNYRISPALALLHELGHIFYQIKDPLGKIAEQTKLALSESIEDQQKLDKFQTKEKETTGNYENYEDMWIIQNVEPKFTKEGRNTHKGYSLKVFFSSFSTFGFKVARGNCSGSTLELKKNGYVNKTLKENK